MARTTYHVAISLVVLIAASQVDAVTSPAIAETGLDEIVEHVANNELLYKNLEVVLVTHFTAADGDGHMADENRTTRIRFVSQDGLFRLEQKVISNEGSVSSIPSRERLVVFDGETTHISVRDASGSNLPAKQANDSTAMQPHTLLFPRWYSEPSPLSVYLQGHEAIKAHRHDAWRGNSELNSIYLGTVEHASLRCHRVRSVVGTSTGTQLTAREFWLAEDRNFLPARMLTYDLPASTVVPIGDANVTEWRELKAGIWFPMSAAVVGYEATTAESNGQRVMSWQERHVVEKVLLDPQLDMDSFREVSTLEGALVYKFQDGNAVRADWHGDSESPGVLSRYAPSLGSWSKLVATLLISLVLVTLVLGALLRRVRTSKPQPPITRS